jgi:hypothetical protein
LSFEHFDFGLEPGVLFFEGFVLGAIGDVPVLVVGDLLPEFGLLGLHGGLELPLPGDGLVEVGDESVCLLSQPAYRLFLLLESQLQLIRRRRLQGRILVARDSSRRDFKWRVVLLWR